MTFVNRVVPGTLIYEATTRLDRLAEQRPPGESRTPEWWDWRTSLRDAEELWHLTSREDPPWSWVP